MNHVVLLGDSIFDNASYVPGGPAVIEQLRRCLPRDWDATLLARDGAVTTDVARQLDHLTGDATHLVVSIGGNDALLSRGHLYSLSGDSRAMLEHLADIHAHFRRNYRNMLEHVHRLGKHTTVCTIYDAVPGLERGDVYGVSLFNDVILREAFRVGAAVIDLRLVCDVAADYSPLSPIEPSQVGGEKIARAISRVVTACDLRTGESRVFG